MPYYLLFIVAFTIVACKSNELPQKQQFTWAVKKREIIDSLGTCNSLKDSIVCIKSFAYRDALHGNAQHFHISRFNEKEHPAEWPARKFYNLFGKDSLTVYCAGNGNFNSALFRELLGHRVISYGVSIGMPGNEEGHYVNLLRIREEQPKYYLADPMFNTVYTDPEGKLIDLRKMIYWARKGLIDRFQMEQYIEPAQFLQSDTSVIDHNATYDLSYSYRFVKSNNAKSEYILKCPRTLQDYLDNKFASTYREIASHYGYNSLTFQQAEEFKYCVLFIKDIYGPRADLIKKDVRKYLREDVATVDSLVDAL